MPIELIDLSNSQCNGHCWRSASPDEDTPWLDYLAKRYREIRTEAVTPILEVQYDGLTFDVKRIQRRLAKAVLPKRSKGPLAVARSDFGETISYCILKEQYETLFGYKSLRDRELTNLPGRGIDAIGIEEVDTGRLRLILGETKTSSDASSPPRVVDSDTIEDCLRKQHLGHLSDLEKTCSKIFDAARRAWDGRIQSLLFASGFLFEAKKWEMLEVVCFSCLVRQQNRYTENDYGSFKDSPDDYIPSSIRFVIFCVPGDDIESVVTKWLDLAQGKED